MRIMNAWPLNFFIIIIAIGVGIKYWYVIPVLAALIAICVLAHKKDLKHQARMRARGELPRPHASYAEIIAWRQARAGRRPQPRDERGRWVQR